MPKSTTRHQVHSRFLLDHKSRMAARKLEYLDRVFQHNLYRPAPVQPAPLPPRNFLGEPRR